MVHLSSKVLEDNLLANEDHKKEVSPSCFQTPSGYQVTGAWTKAGLASCIQVKGPSKGGIDVLFDCGVCEPETLTARHVFISHGHTDHIGAVILHARGSALNKRDTVYYVPPSCVEPLRNALDAFSLLDGKQIPMNIQAIAPGDQVELGHGVRVRAFRTLHTVPKGMHCSNCPPGLCCRSINTVPRVISVS